MARVQMREISEAEELLTEIDSWSDEEIETLSQFYWEKAQEYRRLANGGEREDTTRA